MAVQNCIFKNVTAHLCLYSSGTSTINVVDDWMKLRHDVMTSITDGAWPDSWDWGGLCVVGPGTDDKDVGDEKWQRNCIISTSASDRKEIWIKRHGSSNLFLLPHFLVRRVAAVKKSPDEDGGDHNSTSSNANHFPFEFNPHYY